MSHKFKVGDRVINQNTDKGSRCYGWIGTVIANPKKEKNGKKYRIWVRYDNGEELEPVVEIMMLYTKLHKVLE